MPALNAYPQRPRRDPPYEDEVEAWAMPLGRVGGIVFQLSYSVFVAFAVLAGMIAMVKGRSGNADLPMVALIGSAFWAAGWLVQVLTYCFFRTFANAPIESLTIGLLGIESRPRSWSAASAMLVTSTATLAIITLGAMLMVAESLVIGPRSLHGTFSVWTAPGFGLVSSESVWLSGAWLCWIQAICQMFPLPKSLGRVWLVSCVAVLARGKGEKPQTDIARRLLQVIAALMAMIAIISMGREPNLAVPRWPLFMLLAGVLWISARGTDIAQMLLAFNADTASGSSSRFQTSWFSRSSGSIRTLWFRRKARKALQQERNEAFDAAQLDHVLEQLHEQGIDSLSSGERALLERVSQTLRRQRELESAGLESTDPEPESAPATNIGRRGDDH